MRRTRQETTDVLALSFARFRLLAENALVPSQRRLATEAAGNCLWALGIEEHAGFKAAKPDPIGEVIEGEGIVVIGHEREGRRDA